ncbi:hypothetical protein ACWGS9_30520 [Bradyrhizobium sp. Arg314]
MNRLQQIAILPLDVVDSAPHIMARCRNEEVLCGRHATERRCRFLTACGSRTRLVLSWFRETADAP